MPILQNYYNPLLLGTLCIGLWITFKGFLSYPRCKFNRNEWALRVMSTRCITLSFFQIFLYTAFYLFSKNTLHICTSKEGSFFVSPKYLIHQGCKSMQIINAVHKIAQNDWMETKPQHLLSTTPNIKILSFLRFVYWTRVTKKHYFLGLYAANVFDIFIFLKKLASFIFFMQ